jgi:hypothetical protein
LEKVYGRNVIKRIDDGNVMVSAENVTLTSNCTGQDRELRGSYLIQFSGCSIRLNDEVYANSNVDVSPRLYLPTTGLTVTPSKILNRIPLKYLQDLNLEQRNHIAHLNLTTYNLHWKLHLFGWLSLGTSSTQILFLIVLVLKTVQPIRIRTFRGGKKGVIDAEKLTVAGIPETGQGINLRQGINQGRGDPIRLPRFIPQESSSVKAEDGFQVRGESLGK